LTAEDVGVDTRDVGAVGVGVAGASIWPSVEVDGVDVSGIGVDISYIGAVGVGGIVSARIWPSVEVDGVDVSIIDVVNVGMGGIDVGGVGACGIDVGSLSKSGNEVGADVGVEAFSKRKVMASGVSMCVIVLWDVDGVGIGVSGVAVTNYQTFHGQQQR